MKKESQADISNEELLGAISAGFSALEEKIDDLEGKVDDNGRKIQSMSNRLDAEILRHVDEQADHDKRIVKLEDKVYA